MQPPTKHNKYRADRGFGEFSALNKPYFRGTN